MLCKTYTKPFQRSPAALGRHYHVTRVGRVAARAFPIAEVADGIATAGELPLSAIGLAAVVLPIAGVAGWRASLYSQLEVITARMVGNLVPAEARIIQLGGTTRDLYYYPKTCKAVTVVGESITPGLFEQAGFSAGTPTLAKKQSAANLGFCPDAAVDAVVCLKELGSLSAQQRTYAISEAMRVLKPGGSLIFIEPLTDGASPMRGMLSSTDTSKALAASQLEDLLDVSGLEVMQVDIALEGTDPHAVGLAKRTTSGVAGGKGGDGEAQQLRERRRAAQGRGGAGPRKGFASSS